MGKFSLGVIADSLRLPFRESLEKCAALGADGVQLYAVSGEMAPEALSAADRAEKRRVIEGLGLKVSALCGDLGGHGFADPEANPAKVERSKRIVDLALDLGTNIVTTHIGVVPEDENGETYSVMRAACDELASYAHSVGAYFAIETGPEPAVRLRKFLDSLTTKGVAVNLDPANLVMVAGDDPVVAVRTLKDYIVHTHAKDGVMLRRTDPVKIYGSFAGDDYGINPDDYFREVPLGTGSVDFPAYLAALEEIGYHGFLTVEREVGDDPAGDIGLALDFLRKLTA